MLTNYESRKLKMFSIYKISNKNNTVNENKLNTFRYTM